MLGGIAALPTLRYVIRRLPVVRGWEADNIARSIVGGHGYSFSGEQRWLWEMWNGDSSQYYPTAWADPVFTYLLAAAHWLFGRYAYTFIYFLNFVCIGLILYWAYLLARRFAGPWAGAAAIVILSANSMMGVAFFDTINNTAFSTAVMTAGAIVMVRYFERPDRSRLLQLGFFSGFLVLSCPTAEYGVLLLLVALVLFHWRAGRARWTRSAAVLLMAACVVAPWTIRNYLTFGEWVLVRNGGGQITWDGTVGAASTFAPEATGLELPTPWRSTGPRDAIQGMLVTDQRIAMIHYQVDAVAAAPPPGYETMNEAQRDLYYLDRMKSFVRHHPAIAIQLAVAKLEAFVMRFGWCGLVVFVLAVGGAALLRSNMSSWPLTAMTCGYIAPFILAIPYFGRYRAPLEPILVVLATVALQRAGSGIFRRTMLATAGGPVRTPG